MFSCSVHLEELKRRRFQREQKGGRGFRLLKYKANSLFMTGQKDRRKVALDFLVRLGSALTVDILTCTVNCSTCMNERQF